jgi:hypothetical protein
VKPLTRRSRVGLLHRVPIPQARRVRAASRGTVLIARLTRGRSPATLAVIRSEAELRSLEAALFNPRMLRHIATGARATLLTATDFTIADGLFGRLGDAAFAENFEEKRPTDIDSL